jgi:hypothetical protein
VARLGALIAGIQMSADLAGEQIRFPSAMGDVR